MESDGVATCVHRSLLLSQPYHRSLAQSHALHARTAGAAKGRAELEIAILRRPAPETEEAPKLTTHSYVPVWLFLLGEARRRTL